MEGETMTVVHYALAVGRGKYVVIKCGEKIIVAARSFYSFDRREVTCEHCKR